MQKWWIPLAILALLAVVLGPRLMKRETIPPHPPLPDAGVEATVTAEPGAIREYSPAGWRSSTRAEGDAASSGEWEPAAGESHSAAIEASLFTESGALRTETVESFIESDGFDDAIAALAREASPDVRNVTHDVRSRMAAAFRKDPRFTVGTFACTPKYCLGNVEGRAVPQPDDFENQLYTSAAKPRFYASTSAAGPERNSSHDRPFRVFFTIDPKLNSFKVPDQEAAPPPSDSGAESP